MEKMKTTKPQIKNTYNDYRYIALGYCEAYHLLSDEDPRYYNSGTFGWNYDVYVFEENKIIITTGYRKAFGDRPNYEIVKDFEERARKICEATWKHEERSKLLHNLRDEFFKAIQ